MHPQGLSAALPSSQDGCNSPERCTLPGSTQQRILVVLLKTSQTGVQHFWKRHVRLGGIGLPSILGFHREDANCIHTGCMVVPFSIPAFCIVGIIECYCMHIGCMDGYLFHREGSANCIHVGCMVRSPPTYWRVRKRKFRVLRYVWAT